MIIKLNLSFKNHEPGRPEIFYVSVYFIICNDKNNRNSTFKYGDLFLSLGSS